MKISNNTVVSFQYLLRNDKQEALDSSTPEDPLVYLHGTGELIHGLEQALVGLSVADPANPVEVLRVIHSYDPCVACGVHVIDTDNHETYQIKVL